jgi:uncharacterized integral membrane protein
VRADGRPQSEGSGRQPRRFTSREVAGIVLLVLVLIFALANLEQIKVDFIVTDVTVPLFFVIAVPTIFGFGAGMLFAHSRVNRRARGAQRG